MRIGNDGNCSPTISFLLIFTRKIYSCQREIIGGGN